MRHITRRKAAVESARRKIPPWVVSLPGVKRDIDELRRLLAHVDGLIKGVTGVYEDVRIVETQAVP